MVGSKKESSRALFFLLYILLSSLLILFLLLIPAYPLRISNFFTIFAPDYVALQTLSKAWCGDTLDRDVARCGWQ